MQGQLGEHPLAELIREIAAAELGGALRLERDRARSVIYFEKGRLVFAASNLKMHRLSETLRRQKVLSEAYLAKLPREIGDDELAKQLIARAVLNPEGLAKVRARQVADVLRVALLWSDGSWQFDPRVRLADDQPVDVDLNRLLLESARHLPAEFVTSRFQNENELISPTRADASRESLLPLEGFILSRVMTPLKLSELVALSGSSMDDSLRTIYALCLAGLLQRSVWRMAFDQTRLEEVRRAQTKRAPVVVPPKPAPPPVVEKPRDDVADADELKILFDRLARAADLYEVLDVGRHATADDIKAAYHALAMRYHPDRFHQSEPELRSRVDSAFARIAQAYETLGDALLRNSYDRGRKPQPRRPSGADKGNGNPAAESSFKRGKEALAQNRRDEALRLLAEAALLAPREARYRAHYGHALIKQANNRRIAESELQTAVTLEPNNPTYRIMLAEFYKELGLKRRAEGELQRALAADPRNQEARTMLSSLKG